jgi:hypothetical protein
MANPLYSPSMMPYCSGLMWRWSTRYSGSTLFTISVATSVSRLVNPRAQTTGLTLVSMRAEGEAVRRSLSCSSQSRRYT